MDKIITSTEQANAFVKENIENNIAGMQAAVSDEVRTLDGTDIQYWPISWLDTDNSDITNQSSLGGPSKFIADNGSIISLRQIHNSTESFTDRFLEQYNA